MAKPSNPIEQAGLTDSGLLLIRHHPEHFQFVGAGRFLDIFVSNHKDQPGWVSAMIAQDGPVGIELDFDPDFEVVRQKLIARIKTNNFETS